MNYLNGGYAMIKHNASQKDLANAYKTNRPVLVYDENQRAHWAVIEETATESTDEETQEPIIIYEYSYRLIDVASGGATLDDIVDSAGNKRFVEGNGTPATISGATFSYCKWSLSGTHLMLVLAGTVDNDTTIPTLSNLATFTLPTWILNKIYPIWDNAYTEIKAIPMYNNVGATQNQLITLKKNSTTLEMITMSSVSYNANRGFRVQFDLLIDADYSE